MSIGVENGGYTIADSHEKIESMKIAEHIGWVQDFLPMNDPPTLPHVTPASLLATEKLLARKEDCLDGELADRWGWAIVNPRANARVKKKIEEMQVGSDIARVLLALLAGNHAPLARVQNFSERGTEAFVERMREKVPAELHEALAQLIRLLLEEEALYLGQIRNELD